MLKGFLTVLLLFCIGSVNAQKQASVKMVAEMYAEGKFVRKKIDTFIVKDNYVLEPIMEFYSQGETVINIAKNESSTRNISSEAKLKWYCFTNLQMAVGMKFDVAKTPNSKTILPYQYDQKTFKKGFNFINEPFLANGLELTDYVKEKDTVINGQKCFLVKRTKVIQPVFRGVKMDKIVQFKLAINPKLSSCSFPFVSEKNVSHFGGGAVVYVDVMGKSGGRSTARYTYSELTPAEAKLFDKYQELYNANITLLDKFKKSR